MRRLFALLLIVLALCSAALADHNDVIRSVAFSPDGKRVFCCRASYVEVADVNLAKSLKIIVRDKYFSSMALSPDGKCIVTSGGNRGETKLWDSTTGDLLKTFAGEGVAFSPDGQTVATSNQKNELKLWDAKSGDLLKAFDTARFEDLNEKINNSVFSLDGKQILGYQGQPYGGAHVGLWDVTSGKLLKTFAHDDGAKEAIFFGDSLVTGSNSSVKFWNVVSGEVTWTSKTLPINAIAASPDNKHMALAHGPNRLGLEVVDMATGKQKIRQAGDEADVRAVAFSPDSRFLISGIYENGLELWDVASGEKIRKFRASEE